MSAQGEEYNVHHARVSDLVGSTDDGWCTYLFEIDLDDKVMNESYKLGDVFFLSRVFPTMKAAKDPHIMGLLLKTPTRQDFDTFKIAMN